jgi:hypothetical protein
MPAIGMVASIVLVAERVSVSKVAADESQDGPRNSWVVWTHKQIVDDSHRLPRKPDLPFSSWNG